MKKTIFVCQVCSREFPKWTGQCMECKEWNTLEECQTALKGNNYPRGVKEGEKDATSLSNVALETYARYKTGIIEFDRVLGGGVVPGCLILLGGEPGVGKSTLLIQLLGNLAKLSPLERFLYASGEESKGQITERARRLGINEKNIFLYNETNLGLIKEQFYKLKPKFVIIDSIQTIISEDISSPLGSISQIRQVTHELMNFVNATNTTCIIVGHITKEGTLAGPKLLEHMVDTVIYFEGDQFGHYRLLRATKNRFGNTNEVGVFEMTSEGLQEVANPSQYFLGAESDGYFGRAITCIIEGTRTLFVETQALVVENKYGSGKRTTQGLDQNRLSMLTAIIEKYFGLTLFDHDIYLNIAGGIILSSRDADLSIMAAIISSFRNKPLDQKTVFLGEVGLTGEIRPVTQIEMRLKEIAQLNYSRVITSIKTAQEFAKKFDLELVGLNSARDLENYL